MNTPTTWNSTDPKQTFCITCNKPFVAGEQVSVNWERRAAYATRYGQNPAPQTSVAVGSHEACRVESLEKARVAEAVKAHIEGEPHDSAYCRRLCELGI